MQYEVEQKFAAPDLCVVRGKLIALGAKLQSVISQTDTYFAHPARDFAKTDEALRLRQVGDQNLITYKGPRIDAQTKTRRELELPLAAGAPAFEQFDELLSSLGFSRVLTVRKQREPGLLEWEGLLVHLGLDQVNGLEPFVELEIVACNESLEPAKKAIDRLASALEMGPADRRSYLEMLLAKRS